MRKKTPRYVYDGDLGWVTRPFATWQGDRYAADADGARIAAPCDTASAAAGDLRIAIFGDSFTWGDGVDHGDTWGAVKAYQQYLLAFPDAPDATRVRKAIELLLQRAGAGLERP